AAFALLRAARMRSGVGAEEEPGVARSRGLDERLPVLLALDHREAIVMRPETAGEERVAIEQQVVRRDRRADVRTCALDEAHRLACRGVLDHHLEPGEAREERRQHALEERRLAIEDV